MYQGPFVEICSPFSDFIGRKSRASSANSFIWLVKSDVMSLMYVRNISGPSTVPWGTPERTGASPDDLPSTITLCVLFVKYAVNHL